MSEPTNNNHQDQQAAVMLTVDTGNISMSTLELAVAMAASVQTRLHGLFVENEDLLRVARLPFTREISSTTAEERPTDFDQMQRSIRAMAVQFKDSLQKAAQASQIPWSFDYVSSHTLITSLDINTRRPYTIVARRTFSRVPESQLRSIRRVLLIEDHSANVVHALNIVLKRFMPHRVEVTKVLAEQSDGLDLGELLNSSEQQISLVHSGRSQLTELLTTQATFFDCAIMSRHEVPEVQQMVLKQLHCPVILVS